MKNKKTSLIIVCSLVIMAFFFSLPVIVLKSSDAISDGKIYTSDIKTIEFGKKIDTESLIYLIINGIRMETPESEMNLEADNLRSTIKDSLSLYYENGLITEDFDDYNVLQRDMQVDGGLRPVTEEEVIRVRSEAGKAVQARA